MKTARCILVFLFAITAANAEKFSVVRTRLPRNERGELELTDEGFRYRSLSGKTNLNLPFAEIRKADLSDPNRIQIETYDRSKFRAGANRSYAFRLEGATLNDNLRRLIADHVARPVIASYPLDSPPTFTIPAYHRDLLGGTNGALEIGPAGIRFVGKAARESRTWPFHAIESIGSPDPFHFRVTTFSETYTFDLKQRLPEQAYLLAWRQIYTSANVAHALGVPCSHSCEHTK